MILTPDTEFNQYVKEILSAQCLETSHDAQEVAANAETACIQ